MQNGYTYAILSLYRNGVQALTVPLLTAALTRVAGMDGNQTLENKNLPIIPCAVARRKAPHSRQWSINSVGCNYNHALPIVARSREKSKRKQGHTGAEKSQGAKKAGTTSINHLGDQPKQGEKPWQEKHLRSLLQYLPTF